MKSQPELPVSHYSLYKADISRIEKPYVRSVRESVISKTGGSGIDPSNIQLSPFNLKMNPIGEIIKTSLRRSGKLSQSVKSSQKGNSR
jgi:hypothetical protein